MNTWSERGLVTQGDVTNGKDLISNTDGWDDDIIMKIFDAAVSSHSTKGKAKKKRKLISTISNEPGDIDDAPSNLIGEPGPWEQVSPELFKNQAERSTKQLRFSLPEDENVESQGPGIPSAATGAIHVPVVSSQLEEALQTMLSAWYQSGYATGRYHTLREFELQQQQQQQQQQHLLTPSDGSSSSSSGNSRSDGSSNA